MVKANVKCAGSSDPGRARSNNEDAFHVDPDRGIFLVVDGIGGQAAGERAAEIAVERIKARLERLTGTTEQRIREAITVANNEILREAREHPEWEGMACVLTLAVLENGSAVIGHVGDSRLYQIGRGAIRKITHDHSPVGEREDSQELTESEAMRHPRRNEVFRDVGSEEHTPDDSDFIEVQRIRFEPESALLLCSDGLSDQVPSKDILRTVEQNAHNPEQAVRELIEAANRAGGKDNVTVVLVEGEQFTSPPPTPVRQERVLPPEEPARGNLLISRPAFFLYGLLVAGAGAWFSRPMWVPPAVVITPRVLVAGNGAPYATIGAALAEARDGDTVEVLSGEYHEQVRLRSHVDLRSRVPRDAILRAAPLDEGPAVLADGVEDARLSGFLIQGDAKTPLTAGIVLNNSRVKIDDVEVSGAGTGVEIRGEAGAQLVGSSIHDCLRTGVLIVGRSKAWISGNAIRQNLGPGISAREGAKPSLVGNVFEKNAIAVELPATEPVDLVRARNFFLDNGRPGGGRRPTPPAEARKQ